MRPQPTYPKNIAPPGGPPPGGEGGFDFKNKKFTPNKGGSYTNFTLNSFKNVATTHLPQKYKGEI